MCENNLVDILCSYGGHFVLKFDKYMYEGGTTRLIKDVHRTIKQYDLLLKVKEFCKLIDIAIMKYRHPALIPDDYSFLVSIITDEDVFNMMQVYSQSSTPIRLYVEPSNLVSPSFAAPCPGDGLNSGIIQPTKTVLHENSEMIAFSSQIDGAYNIDGVQYMLSESYAENLAVVNNPRQDLDNGTTFFSNQGMFGHSLEDNFTTVVNNPRQDLDNSITQIPPPNFYESNRTTISSRIVDSQSVGNHLSALVGLHEHDHTIVENDGSRIIQPQVVDNSSCKDTPIRNCSLFQDQEFRDEDVFDMVLREHAIQSHFQYERTNHSCFVVRCIEAGCPWKIYASKVLDGSTRIKILNTINDHTCKRTIGDCKHHEQADKNWIANFIIRNHKHLHSAPKDIIEAIDLQYGIEVSYHKAQRGKESALEVKRFRHSISEVSSYCNEIKKTNPGSFVRLDFSLDGSVGIFIAYHATIHGFKQACRPIIILNSKNIKGEQPHVWLYASGLDADNGEFLLAYAFIESSNTEKWTWFCVALADILGDTPKITIVTKRGEESSEVVSRIFPNAYHRYCRESLYKDFCNRFTSERKNFKNVLFAETVGDFNGYLSSTSPEARKWINDISPSNKHWAVSHFEGQDYKEGPFGDEFAGIWTDDANATNPGVISSLKRFHAKMMETFQQRKSFLSDRHHYADLITNETDIMTIMEYSLTPYAFKFLSNHELFRFLSNVKHRQGNPTQFEVSSTISSYLSMHDVDIEQRTCTCRFWNLLNLPCSHAWAVLRHIKCNVLDYFECYTIAKYGEAYSQIIHPVADEENEMPRTNKKHKKRALMLQKN